MKRTNLRYANPLEPVASAEIYLNIDNQHMAEAEAWIKRAIEGNTKYNTKWELASDHALYADWFKKKGDIQGAKEQLTKAIDIFRECGADGWVEKYEKELVLEFPSFQVSLWVTHEVPEVPDLKI